MKSFTNSTKDISLVQAINSPKIKNLGGLEEIGSVLFYLYSLTGLNKNNYPNRDESLLLANFIHSEFQNYTLEEIKLAFNLAIKMELSQFMGKNDSVDHFQSFSPVYFGKVMGAYKKYKAHNLKPILEKQSQYIEPSEVTDYDFLKRNFVDQLHKYKDGHYPWAYGGADIMIFDFLVKHEIINVPHADKMAKVKELEKQWKGKQFESYEVYKLELFKQVKLFFFKQYIDQVKEFGLDIETVIKNKVK